MRLFKIYLFIIIQLIFLQISLRSQELLFTQSSIVTYGSNVEVSGELNQELKKYRYSLDPLNCEVKDFNGQVCNLISFNENIDTLFLNVFIEENISSEKTTLLLKTINELEANCRIEIISQKYLAKSSGNRVFEDTTNNINELHSVIFEQAIITNFIDSLNGLSNAKNLFLLYSNKKNKTFLKTFSNVASMDKNDGNYYGYISCLNDEFAPFAFFEKLYHKTKKSTTKNANDILLIQYQIEYINNNLLCSKLANITNHYLTVKFQNVNAFNDMDTVRYQVSYTVEDSLFLNNIVVSNPHQVSNPGIISSVEELNTQESGNPSEIGPGAVTESPVGIELTEEDKLNKYLSEGDKFAKNKQFENAFLSYSNYLKLKNDPTIQKKSQRNFELAFSELYKKKDYSSIYWLGNSYKGYYRSKNEVRYYFYQACFAMKDYEMALKGFIWLIDHWDKDQSYLNRDDAFIILEKLYTQTLKFNEAIKLDKRFYRNNQSEDALNSFVKNIRLKHLILLADAYPVFMKTAGSSNGISQLANTIPQNVQSCINGLYLMNKKTNEINQLVKYKASAEPSANELNSIKSYPTVIEDENKEKAWLVNRYENELFIIDFNLLPVNLEEKNLMIAISTDRRSVEPWQELENFESNILRQYCTGILAGMLSIQFPGWLNPNFDKYWSAINQNSNVVYMATYNQRGNLEQSKSFDAEKTIVDEALWSKSFTTKVYFKQEITYDNNRIIDITNPLFNNVTWAGILKIGFAK